MKITRVTITGADDDVSIIDLQDLSSKYPFVEWGILFSKSKEGNSRYPSLSWIKEVMASGLPLSAHFCGFYSKEVLENQNLRYLSRLYPSFKRVQLNYNFSNGKDWDLNPILDYAKRDSETEIILQYNKSNSKALDAFTKIELPKNIHFLYDSSGGRGTFINEFLPPFKNYTGYSGGLSMDNISAVGVVINLSYGSEEVWIDLESGARTNDEFDLEKVESILEKCSKFVKVKQ